MKKIIVLFKTHLDIGFTDMAQKVTENYLKNYLHNAMRVAKQMRGEKEGFIWTAGSWLIEKFLEESPDRVLLEDAVRHGEVRWHGLPFTTHTECMNQDLFCYGLSLSQKLDKYFGMQTIAAKMTDVPGHTISMVPLLVSRGIQFLHLGVNPASTRPDVPTLFWWQAESGEKILVMYNNDYGQMTEIGHSGTAVYFAHTGDNCGPQSAEQIRQVYDSLHQQYPEAELVAGTLEDVAKIALAQEGFPVITEEMGDTWNHGLGTDPRKMSQFRALLRLQQSGLLQQSEIEAMNRELIMVPEHTWGLDEKTWLGKTREVGYCCGEYEIFLKEDFRKARAGEKFRRMEESWKEQRAYVERAAECIGEEVSDEVKQCMEEYRREPWNTEGYAKVVLLESDGILLLFLSGWEISVDKNGAVCSLKKAGKVLADENHKLAGFSYEVFSRNEYADFLKRYQVCDEIWAKEDFDKIGMEKAVSCYREYLPQVKEVWHKDNTIVIRMELLEEAVASYGGMSELETVTGIQKLGRKINPGQVVRHGNRRMHATDGKVYFETMTLQLLDSPLVSVGERSLLKFPDTAADVNKGIYCNLHNNIWGTNFPMWYDEDARFRFIIELN